MNRCQCGYENRPEAQHCGSCGAKLQGGRQKGPAGLGSMRVGGAAATTPQPVVSPPWRQAPRRAMQGGPKTRVADEECRPVAGWLVVLRSREASLYADIPIYQGRNDIGRSPGPQQINDSRVSGLHVRLVAKGGRVIITDMSQNGTFVNNQAVESDVLNPGDMVKMGGTTLVYVTFPEVS